ncbi:CAP domain-containing protein [Proteiniclasticum sp. SCR006]|uniref:CAP domain-containing protein n=1 Tax=Proteiniclasticum aestuarii TaxID=2817862 RepID=A0A939H476_9CLOT|nr:CAP domain-containing protein [Proteiniclasticum aestuarii]MBO1263829.1 CAP domain-containing protein [Proteiniclasticum aestuarii]
MKKLILLFLATSTLFSTSFLFKQNEMNSFPKQQPEVVMTNAEQLSEEKSIITYTPAPRVLTRYEDGFSFDLADKMKIIHGELHLEERKAIAENRKRLAAEAAAQKEQESVAKKENTSDTKSAVQASAAPVKPATQKPSAPAKKPAAAPAETVASKPAPEPVKETTPPKESPVPEPVKEPEPPKESPAPVAPPVEETKTFTYLSQVEKEILTVTNRYRRENGLNNLVWDDSLYQSSRSHTRLMFETNNFAHTTKYAVAENIYMLASSDTSKYSAEFIVAKWMNSPGHRANILDSRVTRMGAGVLKGDQYFAKYDRKLPTLYATQHFK